MKKEVPHVNLRILVEMDQYIQNLVKIPKIYSPSSNLRNLSYQTLCNTDKRFPRLNVD